MTRKNRERLERIADEHIAWARHNALCTARDVVVGLGRGPCKNRSWADARRAVLIELYRLETGGVDAASR